MIIKETAVDGCAAITLERHDDERGCFHEIYEEQKYHGLIGPSLRHVDSGIRWSQDNWSVSKRNVIRGIHVADYAKLVTCVSGCITDFVVDLRPESPTFMEHAAVDLSHENHVQVFVPPGCGHGFYSHHHDTTVIYLTSGRFAEHGEMTLLYNDHMVGIEWPGFDQVVSDRDRNGRSLEEIVGHALCQRIAMARSAARAKSQ